MSGPSAPDQRKLASGGASANASRRTPSSQEASHTSSVAAASTFAHAEASGATLPRDERTAQVASLSTGRTTASDAAIREATGVSEAIGDEVAAGTGTSESSHATRVPSASTTTPVPSDGPAMNSSNSTTGATTHTCPPSAKSRSAGSSPLPRTTQPLPSKPVVLESAFDMLDAQVQQINNTHAHAHGLGHAHAGPSNSYNTLASSPGVRHTSLPNGTLNGAAPADPSGHGNGHGLEYTHSAGAASSSSSAIAVAGAGPGGAAASAGPGGAAAGASNYANSSRTRVSTSHSPFLNSYQWQQAQATPLYGTGPPHKIPSVGTIPYDRHCMELTGCVITFLGPILPTEEEYRVKEATRRQLERLAGRVSPGAKLLAFGSMANGFALRNSDMDLCYLTGSTPDPQPSASELVEILAQLIREETDFNVMPLPKARIPIIKISRSPTPDLPYEIACDIGFENRLALENTRLLLSYAMVDPPRLRTMVLFLKVWTKRRKLNSPYTGTLSSYGYTLLALYYLTHVKKPPVLPNLQRIWPNRPLSPNEVEMNGHDIYFYDDIATLRNEWTSQNTENVGELLIDFFRYFAKEFSYSRDVISLRTENGTFPKDGINWTGELCIEDPFQVGYNVSRPVTKDGLYTIRGEFIRASKILSNRNQRASTLIAELCKEREDGLARAPENPRHPHRYPGGYSTFDSPVRRHYANASGVGGSFAFEAMARGLGRGQQNPLALLPTAAMLAPLSHNGGLTGKPARGPRRRGQQNNMSSAKSDDGMQHSGSNTLVVPYNNGGAGGGVSPGGYVLDQAIDLSEEVSVDSATRSARSFSDTLARSKSLPRQSILTVANGIPRHSQPPSPMTRPQMPTAAPGVSPPMTEILAAIEDMSVQQGETPGRHSSISDTGALLQDSPYADVSTRSSPYQYQTHSPWTFLQPSIAPYVPYTGGGAASASARPSAMAASGSSSQQGVGGWGSQGTTPYLVQEPERLSSSSSSQNSSRRPSHGDNVAYADGHSLPVGEGEGAPVKILHSPLALHSEVIAGKTL